MEILKISATNFSQRGRKLLQGSRQELKLVPEDHVLSLLDLEVLFHVLTNHFDLAVKSLSELVDNSVRIVATEVVEKHWDLEADRALKVTLAVGGSDKPVRDMVVVSDFRTLRFTIYELVTADVAPSGIIIFHLLAATQALHRSICPKYRYDFGFPHDKRVKELGERVFSDFITVRWSKLQKLEVRIAAAAHTLCC